MSVLGIQNSLMGNDPQKLERFLKSDHTLANTPFSISSGQLIRPLEFAIDFTKNIMLVEILLKYGADPNYISPGSGRPIIEMTPSNEVTELLLKYGANPNLIIDEISSLDTAIWGRDFEKAKLFLNYGANPFKSDGIGRSVLSKKMYDINKEEEYRIEYELFEQAEVDYLNKWEKIKEGILADDLQMIQKEISKNFDLNFKDINGISPYQFALNNNKMEIAELLKAEQNNRGQKTGCLGIFILLLIILVTLVINL
jgi:hypothetical protein